MFDEEDDDFYYDDEDYYYDGPCMCGDCRAYRAYWAGYYDALDDLEGLP